MAGHRETPALSALCQEAFVLDQLGNLTAKLVSGAGSGSPPQPIGAALLSADACEGGEQLPRPLEGHSVEAQAH